VERSDVITRTEDSVRGTIVTFAAPPSRDRRLAFVASRGTSCGAHQGGDRGFQRSARLLMR
jgi:hypothetical protein